MSPNHKIVALKSFLYRAIISEVRCLYLIMEDCCYYKWRKIRVFLLTEVWRICNRVRTFPGEFGKWVTDALLIGIIHWKHLLSVFIIRLFLTFCSSKVFLGKILHHPDGWNDLIFISLFERLVLIKMAFNSTITNE